MRLQTTASSILCYDRRYTHATFRMLVNNRIWNRSEHLHSFHSRPNLEYHDLKYFQIEELHLSKSCVKTQTHTHLELKFLPNSTMLENENLYL